MNLLDTIQLYCHVMQQTGGGLPGRRAAYGALEARGVEPIIIAAVAEAVSTDGHLTAGGGGTFALTQLSAS